MIKNKIVAETIEETERFLKKLKEIPPLDSSTSSIQRASAKRASMDLTRQLARFRKTWEYDHYQTVSYIDA